MEMAEGHNPSAEDLHDDPSTFQTKSDEPTKEVSIFDPSVRKQVKNLVKVGLIAEIIISIMVIVVCNLFFSVAWNPAAITQYNMHVAVVDLDQGLIGSSLTYVSTLSSKLGLTYNIEVVSATDFNEIQHRVDKGDFWAAVIANPNASNTLLAALPANSSVGYDPSSAMTLIYDETRCGPIYSIAMRSVGSVLTLAAKTAVIEELMAAYSAQPVKDFKTAVLSQPVSHATLNLHPARYIGILNAFGLSFMQIYLIVTIHTIVVLKLHEDLQGFGFRKRDLMLLMALHRILGSLILSFWPNIVLLMLGAGSTISPAIFFIFWMFTWLCMCTFGALCYHLWEIFGPG